MIKHLWSILCKDYSLDEKTNNISLFNVVEEIGMRKEQVEQIKLMSEGKDSFTIPLGLTLISLLKRDDKISENLCGKIKITLKDPLGKVMLEHERDIEFVANKKRLRLLTKLLNIQLTQVGEYTFFISFKEGNSPSQELGQLPLEVKF